MTHGYYGIYIFWIYEYGGVGALCVWAQSCITLIN